MREATTATALRYCYRISYIVSMADAQSSLGGFRVAALAVSIIL